MAEPATHPPPLPHDDGEEDPLSSHAAQQQHVQQKQRRACPWQPCDKLEDAVARLACLRLSGAHQREGCEWMLAREFATPPSERQMSREGEGEGEGGEGSRRQQQEQQSAESMGGAGFNGTNGEPQAVKAVDPAVAKQMEIRRRKNESKRRQRARQRDAAQQGNEGGALRRRAPSFVPSNSQLSTDAQAATVPVDHYLGVRGGILADSVGLGKTFIAMAVVAANSKHRTLIVTLPSTTIQWCDAIYAFSGMVPSSVLNSRMEAIPEGCASDVIVTTYCCMCKRPPWAMREHWDRVILDEGHVVRNPKTATHAALSMLRADIRWVLSATPIHNGDADMKTLLRWVGARPDVTPLPQLVSHLVLRRTMETEKHRTPCLNLPPLTVENIDVDLQDEELRMYKKIEEEVRGEARREEEEEESVVDDKREEDGGEGGTKEEKGEENEEEKDDEEEVRQQQLELGEQQEQRQQQQDIDGKSGEGKKENKDEGKGKKESESKKRKKKTTAARRGGALAPSAGSMLCRIGQMRQLCISPEVMVRARQARERQELVPSNFEEDDDSCIDRLAEFERGLSSSGGAGSIVVPPAVVSSLMDDQEARALMMMPVGVMMATEGEGTGGGTGGGRGDENDVDADRPPPRQRLRLSPAADAASSLSSSCAAAVIDHPQMSTADIIARFEDARAPRAPASNLSTKLARLCDMVCADLRADPSVKIVIFTTFLAEMDILARELGGPQRRVSCTRIHGGMSLLQRGPSIDMFACPHSGTSVLLAQIMCMSTGVNLQCASVAYITSPTWNPCIEEQAIGRLHRQGQTRPVTVRRLIVRDSIETRCMQVQARKLDIIRSNVYASSSAAHHHQQQQQQKQDQERERERERREGEKRRAQTVLAALAARGADSANSAGSVPGGEMASSSFEDQHHGGIKKNEKNKKNKRGDEDEDGDGEDEDAADDREEASSMTALRDVLARVAVDRRKEVAEYAKKEEAASSTPATALTEGEARHLLFGCS